MRLKKDYSFGVVFFFVKDLFVFLRKISMNWYKEAQLIVDNPSVNYLHIGHPESPHESTKKGLWFWHQGRIITKDLDPEMQIGFEEETHGNWGEMNRAKPIYFGRFDLSTKENLVSVVVPISKRQLNLPGPLIRALVKTFGDDINIHKY